MTCTNIVPKRGCVLASNTSYLDIDQIADATNRPQDGGPFFGGHGDVKNLCW